MTTIFIIFIYSMVILYATLFPFVLGEVTLSGFFNDLNNLFSSTQVKVSEFDILANLLLFGVLGLLCGIFSRKGRSVGLSFGLSVAYAFLFSSIVETLQTNIPGRSASILDVAVDTIAAGLGFLCIVLLTKMNVINIMRDAFSSVREGASPRIKHKGFFAFFLGCLLIAGFMIFREGLNPLVFKVDPESIKQQLIHFEWIPFASYMNAYNTAMMEDIIRKCTLYFMFGGAVFYFLRRKYHYERFMHIVAAVIAVFTAAIIEMAQVFIPARHPDVTDLLLALVAGLLGAVAVKAIFSGTSDSVYKAKKPQAYLTERDREQYNHNIRGNMTDYKLFSRVLKACALVSLASGIFILFLGPLAGPLVLKIGFGVGFIIFSFIIFIVSDIFIGAFKVIAETPERFRQQQKLLQDLRDGTKAYYGEKRKYTRIKTDKGFIVEDIGKTLDISEGGVLLETKQQLKAEQEIDLRMFLPLFPRPINARAKVLRNIPNPGGKKGTFQAGIEFLAISLEDTKKLTETIEGYSKLQKGALKVMGKKKRSMLIVDDNFEVLKLLKAVFEKRGWRVLTGGSGLKGMEIIEKEQLDIMLLDIHLPGESGLDILKEVKQKKPLLPVVMITGLGYGEGLVKQALASGASGYISKDMGVEELVELVGNTLLEKK